MKKITLMAAVGSLAVIAAPAGAAEIAPAGMSGFTPLGATQASAQWGDPPPYAPAYGRRYRDDDRWDDDRWDDRHRVYDRRGRYHEPRRIRRGDRVWRGRDGRVYCQRDNGTTGLVIGAGVGALLGRTIDTRGDRTVGTLLGGALGAVMGRELDRGDIRCR